MKIELLATYRCGECYEKEIFDCDCERNYENGQEAYDTVEEAKKVAEDILENNEYIEEIEGYDSETDDCETVFRA